MGLELAYKIIASEATGTGVSGLRWDTSRRGKNLQEHSHQASEGCEIEFRHLS